MTPLRDKSFKEYWDKRKAAHDKLRDAGKCIILFRGLKRFQVVAPKDELFYTEAPSMGGKYRPRTKVWIFPAQQSGPVISFATHVFGHHNVRVVGPVPAHKCPHIADGKPCGPTLNGFRQCPCEGCIRCPKRIGP